MAFTQYYLDMYVFLDIPLGVGADRNRGEWVLNLNKSVYGLNKSSANWFDLLKTGIERRSYHQSQVNPCVFCRKDSFILTYVDDCVIVSHKQETITSLIKPLNNGPEKYVLTDKGDISNYLCVNISKKSEKTFKSSQSNQVEKKSTMLDLQCLRA